MLQTLRGEDFTSSLDPSRQISLLALSSTISRLTSGLLSDYMSSSHRRHPISRIPLLVIFSTLHFSAFFILALAPLSWVRRCFSIGSVFVGISYGGIFTLAPTVVSVVWGVGGFGRNWGILTFTPGTLPSPCSLPSSSFVSNLMWWQLSEQWFSDCYMQECTMCIHLYHQTPASGGNVGKIPCSQQVGLGWPQLLYFYTYGTNGNVEDG